VADAPLPAPTRLLYLHGFRSSPQSAKAVRTAAWLQQHCPQVHWWCPQLPPSPREAMDLLREGLRGAQRSATAVIGSSLGGFYATALAEEFGVRAVLLNPAVDPARDLERSIGEHRAWHSDEPFYFLPQYIDELRRIAPPALTAPQRLFAVIAKGDEVLSWVEMAHRYRQARLLVLDGGDHALSDYEQHLEAVMAFLGLTRPSAPGSAPHGPRPPR
jgi:predicted esterase YcpF (UPF0227 family)